MRVPARSAAAVLMVISVAVLLSACGSDGDSSATGSAGDGGSKGKLAFLVLQTGAERYEKADVPAFTKTAEAAGYEVTVQSAENDAATQQSQAENVLNQGVDVLVLQPVSNEASAAIVQQAEAAEVPVVSYNDLVSDTPVAAFVGRNPELGARRAAEAVLEAAPQGNYVLISGDEGQTVAQGFLKGFEAVLDPAEEKGDISIVSAQYTPEWSTEAAVSQAENALTKTNDDVVAILTAYDAQALGVVEVLRSRGLAGKVLVTGQDLQEGGAQAIAKGTMFGSVWGSYDEMGELGAEVAIGIAEEKPLETDDTIENGSGAPIPWYQVPIYLVTKENLPEFVCDHPEWIPAAVAYKTAPADEPTC